MRGLLKRIKSLPRAWMAALFVVVIFGGAAASIGAYRTYDYVQHDNDFCLSCHLMVEPYELFAQSAHRDLGCKACHTPTLIERSTMGLAQFVDNPDSIRVHADVPDENCTSCHVDGDPEQWTLIANSAGHQVHFESTDTALADIGCVGCHSSGLHEFAATDQTCAQSGCHTDVEVTLGRMGDFTIHCTSCHSFSAPVQDPTLESAQAALAPDADACLSCHVMRTLVEIPEDEPHQAVCATCHNPHDQDTPQEAVETCATSGCHEAADTLSPFHEGLTDHPLDDCSSCHTAHVFRVEGEDCLSCHADIYDDAPGRTGQIAAAPQPHPQPLSARGAGRGAVSGGGTVPAEGTRFAMLVHREPVARLVAPEARARPVGTPPGVPASHISAEPALAPTARSTPQAAGDTDRPFRHGTHRTLDCASCHDSSDAHGELTVDAPVDCASCHHTTQVVDDCASCHAPVERVERPRPIANWAMTFSTGLEATRQIPFVHSVHEDSECADCHTDGIEQPVATDACAGCHVEHHADPVAQCVTCHEPPPDDAHDVASHLGCGGAGCHTDLPFELAPRQGREGCISCHTDLVDHEPEGACVTCHQLPAPRRGLQ
jgi:nitrate/TMAO reductase-like tetraheme cytochrome c subunit